MIRSALACTHDAMQRNAKQRNANRTVVPGSLRTDIQRTGPYRATNVVSLSSIAVVATPAIRQRHGFGQRGQTWLFLGPQEAITFYQKFGFEETEVIKDYYKQVASLIPFPFPFSSPFPFVHLSVSI